MRKESGEGEKMEKDKSPGERYISRKKRKGEKRLSQMEPTLLHNHIFSQGQNLDQQKDI